VDEGLLIRELTEADVAAARRVMMRSVLEDFADSYDPVMHADVDDLAGAYIRPVGAFMFVVVDTMTGDLLATGGVRTGAFQPDRVPPQLALLERRYRDGRTGQIVRVYVLKEHRRRGIARALVRAIIDRVRDEALYERLALHTYPHSPGALAFWTSMSFQEVLDDVKASRQIFFELPPDPQHDDLESAATT